MVSRKHKIGFFLTDASFDYKTKVASVAILNLKTNKKFNVNEISKNPKEAENLGILEALKRGTSYENIVIFCDNLFSVNEIRKKVLSSNYWKSKYKYIQLVWVPREETHLADFFSKNLDTNEENLNEKIKSFELECSKSNVMDIIVSKKDKLNILDNFLKESKLKFPFIDKFQFKSKQLEKVFLNNKIDLKNLKLDIESIHIDLIELMKIDPSIVSKDSSFYKLISGIINF